jgi:hypothetical protein
MTGGVYWTGLVVPAYEELDETRPINGRGWRAILHRRRAKLHLPGHDLIVEAKTWLTAQTAAEMVAVCHEIISGGPAEFGFQVVAHNRSEPAWVMKARRLDLHRSRYSTSGFWDACAMAARASRRRAFVYALAQYALSSRLFSLHDMEYEPTAPHLGVTRSPRDHVTFSAAIVSAYATIEELGLEIRVPKGQSSKVHGVWNPAVRADLELRLKSAGIAFEEPFPWMRRGPDRRIERARPLVEGKRARWAYGPVRDVQMDMCDAIARASHLRSSVAAHGFKPRKASLTAHDVGNVQRVAGRLLGSVLA